MDDTSLGTVVLGLDDFELTDAVVQDGEVWLHVQTTARSAVCPSCWELAVLHDRRRAHARDLPVGGRPARLVWAKRIWRCVMPWCVTTTWTEQRRDVLRPRFVMTERARREACDRVADGATVTAQAARFGVGWDTIMTCVRDHGLPRVNDPARTADVRSLGVDETSFLAAGRQRRTTFVTGLVDLDAGRLLDIVEGRAGRAVAGWLEGRDEDWLGAVQRVALDPHRGYYNALLGGLHAPTVVVDAFHIVRLANTVVDEVRRRVQQDLLGHRGHKGDPLYGIRRLLLLGAERLSPKSAARLGAGLAAGDPDADVWYAHHCKELLRAVYRADGLQQAEERLEAFLAEATAEHGIAELYRLARTIRRWRAEILAYYQCHGLSNGKTEVITIYPHPDGVSHVHDGAGRGRGGTFSAACVRRPPRL